MPPPPSVTMVTVNGQVLHPVTGTGATGTVTFLIPDCVRTSDGYLIGNLPATIATVTNGTFTVSLPATDDTAVIPQGWVYTIIVNTDAYVGTFTAALPSTPNPTTLAAMPTAVSTPPVSVYVPLTEVGAPNGVAGLDGTGKVPPSQLPAGGQGTVTSVAAADGTIVVGGTPTVAPTVRVGSITESQVTNLTTDLAGRVTLATATTKGDLLAATGSAALTRLGVGSDGTVLTAASGQATGLTWATPSVYKPTIRSAWITTGDVTLPTTAGAWQQLLQVNSSPFELDIPAAVGDWVEIGVHGMRGTQSSTAYLDIGVLVGAGIARFLATGTSTAGTEGDPGWYPQSTFVGQGASRGFTVTSGDLDTGGVVRFAVVVKAGGSGVMYASTNYPFYWRALDLGPHN